MIPGQLIAPGVNFTSVHDLTPVTIHMSFSLPRGNFEVTFLDSRAYFHGLCSKIMFS